MSRIDRSSGGSGNPIENDAQTSLAPPPDASTKPPDASQPPPGNLVEAYDPRLPQPEQHSCPGPEVDRSLMQFPASALQLPGVPAKRLDVGGEPVRQAGADPKPGPSARRGADESLDKAAFELISDAKNGDVVLRELKQLPKPDLEATLGKLDRAGELGKALAKLSPEQRGQLIARMEQLGLISVAHSTPPSTTTLNPPPVPDLPLVSDGMPAALRDAVLAHDQGLVAHYRRDEAAYQQRYVSAVRNAKSGAELRELGAHEAPRTISFPGEVAFYNGNPGLRQSWATSIGYAPSDTGVRDAIDKRVCELAGRSRPGYSLDAEVEAKGENGSLRRSGSVDSDGHQTEQLEARVQQKNGAVVSVDSDGKVSGGHHSSGGGLEMTETVSSDGEHEFELEAEHKKRAIDAKVAFNRNGEVSKLGFHVDNTGAEFDGSKVELSIGHGGFTASTTADVKERTLGAALAYDGKIGDATLKVKVGFSARGITPEEAKDVARAEGTFATPTLLQAGVPWERLTPDQRAAFERFAWTREEWNSKLPKK